MNFVFLCYNNKLTMRCHVIICLCPSLFLSKFEIRPAGKKLYTKFFSWRQWPTNAVEILKIRKNIYKIDCPKTLNTVERLLALIIIKHFLGYRTKCTIGSHLILNLLNPHNLNLLCNNRLWNGGVVKWLARLTGN